MLSSNTQQKTNGTISSCSEKVSTDKLRITDEADSRLLTIIEDLIEENNELKSQLNKEDKYIKKLCDFLKAKNIKSALKKLVNLTKHEANNSLLIKEIINELECGKKNNIISNIKNLQSEKEKYYNILTEIANICGVDNYSNALLKINKLFDKSKEKKITFPFLKTSWTEGKKESEIRIMRSNLKSTYSLAINEGASEENLINTYQESVTFSEFIHTLKKVAEPKLYQRELELKKQKEVEEGYRKSWHWMQDKVSKIIFLNVPNLYDFEVEWDRVLDFKKNYLTKKIEKLIDNPNKWNWHKKDFDFFSEFKNNFENSFPEIEIYDAENYTWEYHENSRTEKF